MKLLRDNFAYIFLGIVALILLFVTISLQVSLSNTQSSDATSTVEDARVGPIAALREQLAAWGLWSLPEATDGQVNTAASPTVGGVIASDVNNADGIQSTGDSTVNSVANVDPLPAPESMAALLYAAENLTVSEDDTILANIIAANPNSVGFFGYTYYQENQERLRAIAIRLPDGTLVAPNATTVAAGTYPLARLLYLYTSPTVLSAKPEVEAFLGCYLNRLPEAVSQTGYILPSSMLFGRALQSFDATCQRCRREAIEHPLAPVVPVCDLSDIPVANGLHIVGSSTLAPLSRQVAELVRAEGFGGEIVVDSGGTGAGFSNFCNEAIGDIVDASRSVKSEERERCDENNRRLLPFPVAVDALTIVVSRQNTFFQAATIEQLQQIFAHARAWSEIDPSWPNQPISRAIPGRQSGTFDYFVEAVMEGNALATLSTLQSQPLSEGNDALADLPTTAPALPPSAPQQIIGTERFVDNRTTVRLGVVENDPLCAALTDRVALVLARNFGLPVEQVFFADMGELFATLAEKEAAQRVDLTFCYRDPTDRPQRQIYFSYTEFIGSGFLQNGDERLVVMANRGAKIESERNNRCLSQFLSKLNLSVDMLSGQSAITWYDQNQATIDAWLQCQ